MSNLFGQRFPIFDYPHSKKKYVLASSQNFPCTNFCSLPLILSLFISEKRLTVFSNPPIKWLYTMRSLFSLFSS